MNKNHDGDPGKTSVVDDHGGMSTSPAIWLYPKHALNAELTLTFRGEGFMTSSTPSYNERWRVYVDPSQPFNRYSSTYVDDPWRSYLDYDGFRAGEFQRSAGWCVEQKDLMQWHRTQLRETGFSESEIDDVNYSYVRMLLSRQYKDKFFAVYPQDTDIVESSVSLSVTPQPDSIYRLWLYFVPVADKLTDLKTPRLKPVERKGFALVELAYLTDREIPSSHRDKHKNAARSHFLAHHAGVDTHKR